MKKLTLSLGKTADCDAATCSASVHSVSACSVITSRAICGIAICGITTSLISCGIIIGSSNPASALTYQSTVNPSFTINPSVTITLSSADLVISNLSPSTASDSNVVTITAQSNNSTGYVLNTTVGNNTTYNTTNLVFNNTNSNPDPSNPVTDNFTSLDTTDSISTLSNIAAGKWGYSYSTNSGSTWSNYSGLPLYSTTTPKELVSTNTPTNSTVEFKIAASAKNNQTAGEYNNIINFIATVNPGPYQPAPIACASGKICYNPNADPSEVTDSMGDQSITTTATTASLWASNFQRPGYGFAGWTDKYDWVLNQNDQNGNGTGPNTGYHIYGPNETISFTAGQYSSPNSGLALYAVWVPSAGNLQGWTGCSNLNTGQITALTDTRDNQVYTVAKLGDNKCWMVENLRLDNQYTTGAENIAKAQGYNSSFIGLANPETANFTNSTTANSLYSTDGSTAATISGSYQGYRFPRYNNQNTASPTANMTAWNNNSNTYSVGNYYTWAAAIADTTHYSSGDHNTTSICPTGWHIPTGGSSGEYKTLNTEQNSGSTSSSTGLRAYPANFVYSGYFYDSSPYTRGASGYYWSSTAYNSNISYGLGFGSSNVYPGTSYYNKSYGRSIRCSL